MSGKASRSKGIRMELKLRDELKKLGYESNRIPLSGSMQGYKGDVKFWLPGGQVFTAEVKSRKDSFKSIYDALYATKDKSLFLVLPDSTLAVVSTQLAVALNPKDCFTPNHPIARRIKTLQKLVQDCTLLAVKDDRMDFLFIRYL